MKKVLAILLACLLTLSFSIPVFAIGEEMTVKKAAVTVDGKIDDAPRRNIERLSTEPVFLAVARPFKTRITRMRVAGVDGEIPRRAVPFLRRAVSARRFEGVVLNDEFLGARREADE